MSIAQRARKSVIAIRRYQKPAVVLGLMIAGFGLAHISWILQDTRPMHHWDPYAYLGNLLAFLDGISQGDTAAGRLLADLSHLGRPPLYQLMTAPLVLLLGRSVDAALMINVLFLALLLVSTYDAARQVSSERAGYLAAFLVSTYPTMAHLAHVYRPHYAIPACVALSLALLLRVVREPSAQGVWWLGLSVVFGLWIHPLYGFFGGATIGFGALGALLYQFSRNLTHAREMRTRLLALARHPLTLRAVLPALLLATALAAAWYGPFSRQALAHFLGNLGLSPSATRETGLTWHLRTAPSAISNLLFVGAVAAFLNFVLKRRLMTVTLLFGVVGAFLAPAVLLSRPTWWNSASLLPPLAILTACWIAEIQRPLLARTLFGAAVLVATFNFSVAMWDIDRSGGHFSKTLGAPSRDSKACAAKSKMIFCPDPPRQVHWPYREMIATALEDDACQGPPGCRVMVIGSESFSSYIFGYTAQRHWPRADVVVESQGLRHRPFPLRCFLESDYVLYVDFPGKLSPRSSLSYSVAARVLLQSPPAALARSHRTVATFELPNGRTATVARRAGPVTEPEVEAVAEALRSWNVAYDRNTRYPAGGRCSEAQPAS